MRTLRYSIVTGTFACGAIFASFYACKSTQPLGESSIQSTAAVPISGDEYETDPIYADKVVPVGSIKDSVLPSSYNESNLFSDKIDQRVDLRLDTAEYVKKLEDEGKFKKGDFTSSLGFSRLAYSKALTSIGRKPENFAAASVLAAMRRMRRFMNTVPFESKFGSGTWLFADRAAGIPYKGLGAAANLTSFRGSLTYSQLSKDGGSEFDFVTPFDEFKMTWNTDGIGSLGNNLSSMPWYWDDIQAHFYVLSPHRRHGCWTSTLGRITPGTIAYIWADKKAEPHHLRFAIRDICTGRIFLEDPDTKKMRMKSDFDFGQWATSFAALPVEMSAYNLMWLNPKTGEFVTPTQAIRNDIGKGIGDALKKLQAATTDIDKKAAVQDLIKAVVTYPGVQWAEKQRKKGYVNMWEYIMLHRLYAWDWEQQHAVIMAFYSDHKRFKRTKSTVAPYTITNGDTKAIDANDSQDCETWVPSRLGDPTGGQQCQVGKVITQRPLSAGR